MESTWRFTKNVKLSADNRQLIWERPYSDRRTKDLNERQLFADFVELGGADASPQDFLRFAKSYGPLLLCEHGLPMSHIDLTAMEFLSAEVINTHAPTHALGRLTVREDLDSWRRFACQGHAMTSIASDLRLGQSVETQRWAALARLVPSMYTVDGQVDGDIAVQRRMLARAVQTWLDWSDVRVTYEWNPPPTGRSAKTEPPRTRIGASSLFGSLALSLTLGIAGAMGFGVCSGCGQDFVPKRPRDPSKKAWCYSTECRKAKQREDTRRSREREKGRATED